MKSAIQATANAIYSAFLFAAILAGVTLLLAAVPYVIGALGSGYTQ